jgi:hypothetical protein
MATTTTSSLKSDHYHQYVYYRWPFSVFRLPKMLLAKPRSKDHQIDYRWRPHLWRILHSAKISCFRPRRKATTAEQGCLSVLSDDFMFAGHKQRTPCRNSRRRNSELFLRSQLQHHPHKQNCLFHQSGPSRIGSWMVTGIKRPFRTNTAGRRENRQTFGLARGAVRSDESQLITRAE